MQKKTACVSRILLIVTGIVIPLLGLSLGFLYWKSSRHAEAKLVLDGIYLVRESGWCLHDVSAAAVDTNVEWDDYDREEVVKLLGGPFSVPYYRLKMFCHDDSRPIARPEQGPTIDVGLRNTGNAIAHLHSLEVTTIDYTDIGPLAGGTHLYPATEVPIQVMVPKLGAVRIPLSETVSGDDVIRLQFYFDLPNDATAGNPDYNTKRCLTRLAVYYNQTQLTFAVMSFLYVPDFPARSP